MAGPGADLGHQRHQPRLLRRVIAPVLGHERIERLPADQRLLHQRAHRIDHLEPAFGRQRATAGQRRIPAHRIAGHGNHLDPARIYRAEIAKRAGIDQTRGIVAARVFGDGIGRGSVQRRQRLLPQRGRRRIEARQQGLVAKWRDR